MKRGTVDHPKMKALARELRIPIYAAVGLMEMLWHWARNYAPQGDIGRWGDPAIAKGCGWGGDASRLCRAWVACGWVDPAPEPHRLVIHDISCHADNTWKQYLYDQGLTWWDGSPARNGISGRPKEQSQENLKKISRKSPVPEPMPEPMPEPEPAKSSGDSETASARSPQPTGFSTPAHITPEKGNPEPTSVRRKANPAPDVSDPAEIPRLIAIRDALIRFCRACPAPVGTWDAPDWGLCQQLLAIAGGGDRAVSWISGFLADLERGGRKPTTSYGWFVTLAREAMAGGTVYVGGGKLALMPPAQTDQPETERKAEAM